MLFYKLCLNCTTVRHVAYALMQLDSIKELMKGLPGPVAQRERGIGPVLPSSKATQFNMGANKY